MWQHSLPFKVKESVCFEPQLEVDSEVEPKTGQGRECAVRVERQGVVAQSALQGERECLL